MTSSQQHKDSLASLPPRILIEGVEVDELKDLDEISTNRRPVTRLATESSRLQVPAPPRRSSRKRTARIFLEDQVEDKSTEQVESSEEHAMSSQSSKHKSESSSKRHHGSSGKKERKPSKSDDWSEVMEPEERRRIQNRIAQRKFREKTRDNKVRAEREQRNQEYAGSSYHIPTADDLAACHDQSGLPWGGIDMRHVMSRGHEDQSRRSSSRGDQPQDDNAGRYFAWHASSAGVGVAHAAGPGGSAVRSSSSYQHPSYGSGEDFTSYEEESPSDFAYDYDVNLDSQHGHHYHR